MVFGLSVEPKVHYSRPSIDVLFESAAAVYAHRLVGVILTGANTDGSQGLKKIAEAGGHTIVQDPEGAEFPEMPLAAINLARVDEVMPMEAMGVYLASIQSN